MLKQALPFSTKLNTAFQYAWHEHSQYNKADWPLLPVNQTEVSNSVQAQDRPQPPQLPPTF